MREKTSARLRGSLSSRPAVAVKRHPYRTAAALLAVLVVGYLLGTVTRSPAVGVPTVRGVGAVASGTGAISAGLPAGTASGDLLVYVLETQESQTITVSGWTQAPGSPQDFATLNTRMTVFYKIAAGGDATTTSDSGDHQLGRIIGITAGSFDAVTPFNASAGSYNSSGSVTITFPTVTTTVADTLVLVAGTTGYPDADNTATTSGFTNAALTSLTERIDNASSQGDGGSIFAATGAKTTAGVVGTTTATHTNAAGRGVITLAIAPSGGGGGAPPTPTGLSAVAVSSTQIDLTWNDVAGETSYIVERSSDGSTGWAVVGTNTANDVTFSNTGLTASTTYYYRVFAAN